MLKPLVDNPKARAKFAIIENSQTVKLYGAITPSTTTTNEHTKYVKPAGNSDLILGVVVGFGRLEGGRPMDVASKIGITQLAAASDNVGGDNYGVWYIPAADRNVEYAADLDADAGTTTGSSGIGFFDLLSSDSSTLDESSYAKADGTAGQFVSYGLVDGETDVVKVRINQYI